MSNLNIAPQTVLLTSGQAVTFEAANLNGQAAPATWSLNPPIGSLVAPAAANAANAAPAPTSSVTYVAPPLVNSAQTIAIIASTGIESASATISLTPDAITIIPAKVDLKADQTQQFIARIATAPPANPQAAETITWVLSPPLGTLDQKGLYTSPHDIPDSTTVNVIATSPTLAKQAAAVVSLASPPWQGAGVQVLGGYLLLVFSLVLLIVGLWPPALPSPDSAKASRIESERALESARAKLKSAQAEAGKRPASNNASDTDDKKKNTTAENPNSHGPTGSPANANLPNPEASNVPPAETQDAALEVKNAQDDLEDKRSIERDVNETTVHTKLGDINRELDLLWLVLLAGTLGSFLHTAQSYSEYVGNRTLKSSWAWWYSFRPFIGAGLALVFYAAVRGGFMAMTTGSSAKASELNPFGVVSVAAMVGMFSKAATVKLGEVFDTLFKSDKAKESKDTLDGSQTAGQPAKPASGGGAAPVQK